jgi:hypothetical protein
LAHPLSRKGRPGGAALTAIALAACLLSACGRSGGTASGPSISPECRSAPSATVAEATTASYHMALAIGPAEQMQSESHATATAGHPMQGEVMVRGQMTILPGMNPGMSMSDAGSGTSAPVEDRHLEVHICSKITGRVVQDAQPVITVTDNSAGGTSQQVPVSVMEGAGQGMEDLHYGNNVVMAPGHTFTVSVVVGSEQATFSLKMPSHPPGSSTSSPENPTSASLMPGMTQGMVH